MTTVELTTPTLRQGSQGAAVKRVQKLLLGRVALQGLAANSIFDEATDLAVRVFQIRAFLEVDGIVGPQTWLALLSGGISHLPRLHQGHHGALIQRLQQALNFGSSIGPKNDSPTNNVQAALGHRGFYAGAIDGKFGPLTHQAVIAYQQLPLPDRLPLNQIDGIVGPETWSALTLLMARVTHLELQSRGCSQAP